MKIKTTIAALLVSSVAATSAFADATPVTDVRELVAIELAERDSAAVNAKLAAEEAAVLDAAFAAAADKVATDGLSPSEALAGLIVDQADVIVSLEQDISALEAELAYVNLSVEGLHTIVGQKEARIVELETEIASLNKSLKYWKGQASYYKTELWWSNVTIAFNQIGYASLNSKYNDLKDRVIAARTYADTWETKANPYTSAAKQDASYDGSWDVASTGYTQNGWVSTNIDTVHVDAEYTNFDISSAGDLWIKKSNLHEFNSLISKVAGATYDEGFKDGYNAGYEDGFNDGKQAVRDELN